MNLKDYQVWTTTVDNYPEDLAFDCYVMGLCSEAGEVAGKVKKEYRDDVILEDEIISELGDCLWYLTRMTDHLGLTLDELAALNYSKIEGRKRRDTIKGSGDNR